MLTPLIVMNITPLRAKSPPPSPVRPMEVAGGGRSYEYMRVFGELVLAVEYSVVPRALAVHSAEHAVMSIPLIAVKVTLVEA